MSLLTLPPIEYDRDSDGEITPRRIEKQLGDGYKIVAADGLNSNEQNFTIQYTAIANANAITLRDFFRSHADGTPFYFTLPLESTARKWRVQSFTIPQPISATHANMSAVFEEEFGL